MGSVPSSACPWGCAEGALGQQEQGYRGRCDFHYSSSMAFDGLNPNCPLWLFHIQHLQIQWDGVMNHMVGWTRWCEQNWPAWKHGLQLKCWWSHCGNQLFSAAIIWWLCTSWLFYSEHHRSSQAVSGTQNQTAGSKTAVKPNSECTMQLHLKPSLLLQLAIQHNLKLNKHLHLHSC